MSLSSTPAVLIPAYKPAETLVPLVERLSVTGFSAIVVVDDGSGPEFRELFAALARIAGVSVVRHAVNLGKGAALKTGLNQILCERPASAGVITADADGQHDPADIRRVAEALTTHPNELILGARHVGGGAPLRSRFGNHATRMLFGVLVGRRLRDTQTGLRGIPMALVPRLLRLGSSGYEFELEMLLLCKHLAVPIREVEIRTIYLDDNASSHFDPFFDSMRIYFVLLRFSALSLLTALIDNAIFFVAFGIQGSVLGAQVVARSGALLFNYAGARNVVFLSRESHRRILPRYLLLVVVSGIVSYGLIQLLRQTFGIGVLYAKVLAETTLFIANFTIQRDLIFRQPAPRPARTDWDEYYTSVPATAKLTRKYTTRVLLDALRTARRERGQDGVSIIEIGGANSCFVDRILSELRPSSYHVIDTSRYGLELLRARSDLAGEVSILEQDVLNLSVPLQADVVFSVGLIEHFDVPDTRKAILAHFDLLKPGGYAILSFPTPTFLYRATRGLLELAGLWKFPDERPLERAEVSAAVGNAGRVVREKVLWPLMLTQRLMLFRKAEAGQ